jgi:hypothetical protein
MILKEDNSLATRDYKKGSAWVRVAFILPENQISEKY